MEWTLSKEGIEKSIKGIYSNDERKNLTNLKIPIK